MKTTIAAIALALAFSPVRAHDDATLDRTAAPNGGQLRMAGPYHLELVVARNSAEVRENPVLVYVTDHGGKSVPTQAMKASVSLIAGKQRATVTLAPDGENRLKGVALYSSDPAMKAVVSVAGPDGKAEQARFEPLVAGAAAAGAKQ